MKANEREKTRVRGDGAGEQGYLLWREDDLITFANPSLRLLTAPWAGPEGWWRLIRGRITLPPATQCPTCSLAQYLGSCDASLFPPEGAEVPTSPRIFEITFSGHAHGLAEETAGNMLLVRDVTAWREERRDLVGHLKQYESLCESIQDVYYRTDLQGRLAFISPSVFKLLAYRPEELVGRAFASLCIDPEYWSELLQMLTNHDSVTGFDLVLECREGSQVPVAMNAHLVTDPQGRVVAVEGILQDISEREQLDRILADRTRKLQETMAELEHQKFALDQHAIVSITDSEGRIVYANRRLMEISQYAWDELKGSTHRVLNSGFHPKSFFKEMWRTIGNGRVWHGEIRNRKKDGSLYWVDSTVVPFMTPSGKPYQFVSISTDITERIEAEQRLEKSRGFLLSITDAMGEGVYVLDTQGRVTFLNRKAERLLGWREEELLGKNLHGIIHFKKPDGSLYPAEECPVHRSLLGRSFRVDEDHFVRKDGGLFPVSYVTAPFLEGGEITGTVAVFQDIAQRQKAERELKQARDGALEASRLKSVFLANMSHEIRTPMNAIVGMNDLLMDTLLNDEQIEFAEIIRESANSLLAIINDILDFSKIEAGKLDLEVIDFTLPTVVEGCAELLAAQAQEKGLSLMTFIDPGIPRVLRGDPGRLRQMLLNLIANAVKFTEEGEVVVRAVVERETSQGIMVGFSITDSGPGIPEKALARLFQPFTQATGDTSRKYGGTGLGLAISKRLAELMGGEIGIKSQEGVGSVFWFRLPFAPSDLTAGQANEELALEPLKGRRILMILERGADEEILCGYLSAWGMRCEAVRGGNDALLYWHKAQQRGEHYDAVIIAAGLADIDVLTLPVLLGNGRGEGAPPLLALTDSDDKEWEESARNAGFQGCLAKPVRQAELVQNLADLLFPELLRLREESLVGAVSREAAPVLLREPDAYDALESGKLLLLAEDNAVNQKVAIMQLKRLGYAAHAVANGKEALEAVTRLPYALILMDCQMPVMDGFEATHAIRKLETTTSRHIPIIAMTANAMKGDRERCLKAGMDDYLSKPVSPDELRRKLEYWIPKSVGELPPIELDQLYQLFGRNDDAVREILNHFIPSTVELLERLRGVVEKETAALLEETAHELKGACSNMGATAMAILARRMERAALATDWMDAAATMKDLERAFARVQQFVSRF